MCFIHSTVTTSEKQNSTLGGLLGEDRRSWVKIKQSGLNNPRIFAKLTVRVKIISANLACYGKDQPHKKS